MDQVRPDGRRQGGQGRRRQAFDALVLEVDSLPHLDAEHRETLRRRVESLLGGRPDEPAVADPPLERLLALLTPQEAEGGPEALARYASALRRCLEAHSDGARKIATYLHALHTLDPDDHVLEIDV
ncbi:MAG TPA: hypothetical protein VED40_15770 [Azospirillaceae bacterium]|nr:hypothetical protein [Azospirillaceae bacterium]